MANNYKFPGVYPKINDLSQVVADNAITVCAYVGEAEYGPVNKPVLLSNLTDYTNKFGSLSSKYGYAGYSLAVAAESIDVHRFVRVIPVDGAKPAKYAYTSVNVLPDTGSPSTEGWTIPDSATYLSYTAVSNWENNRDAGEDISSMLFANDTHTAMVIMAADPNDRNIQVALTDTTINTYRASPVISDSEHTVTTTTTSGVTTVTVWVNKDYFLDESEELNIAVGDSIKVSGLVATGADENALNGIFKVSSLDTTTSEDYISIVYQLTGSVEVDATRTSSARVGRYPNNDEKTFAISVYETVKNATVQLENFEYCTLYHATNENGSSTYVEDVINGNSNLIQIFVNTSLLSDANGDETYPVPVIDGDRKALTGGDRGKFANTNDLYNAVSKGWDNFYDREQVVVSLLMNCGYVSETNTSVQSKMLEIAEHRRDCFCLFDSPASAINMEDLIDWRSNTQGFTTYRGAISAPWVKTYDAAQGRSNFVMCPSAYVAKIMGMSDPWVAPAGLNRGVLSASTVSPTGLTTYYNTTEGGTLYTDNQINCIIKNPGAGYVNWGQRTCQKKPSALDRINVARTIIYIETVLRDAAKYHLFENNTPYERTQITLQFSKFLDTILSAQGIQRYQVVCDESNNPAQVIQNNQLVVDVYIWPTYTVEVIKLQTNVMAPDAEVSITSV